MLLANYQYERDAFKSLLEADCRDRILMFQGASGSGKTTLLAHCGRLVPDRFRRVPIQLRGNAVSVAEIFSRSAEHLGRERLANFNAEVESLQGSSKVEIEGARSIGFNNQINVALTSDNPTDREDRRVALTDALFEDMKFFDHPLLFLLDTFEQANTEVQQWISGPFLARTAHVSQIRVLVAGQRVPDSNNIEWGHLCKLRKLIGVPDAEAWLPVVQQMGRIIPRVSMSDSPLTWLAGVCHALNGEPSRIMQIIEALPSVSASNA